jgi:ABC-2 type transport system ATP-binding protein
MSTAACCQAVLECAGLSRNFGALRAVSDFSLRLEQGEMFALVGPDGAGKTTILRLLCGILAPAAGRARLLGKDLLAGGSGVRTRLGYLSQGFSLYGDLSVDENIAFFAGIHSLRDYRRRRDELLEMTRLTPYRKRLADRLSGGMKKKLALACTLIHAPELLLLDEPTTGVDPVSRRDFWIILSGLLRTGLTVLLTTPYLDEAERCTRVGLLSAGRLLRTDTPEKIRQSFPYHTLEIVTGDLQAAAAFLETRMEVQAEDIQVFGDRLHLLVPKQKEAAHIESLLAARGLPVESCRAVPPSLENVFIFLMKNQRSES